MCRLAFDFYVKKKIVLGVVQMIFLWLSRLQFFRLVTHIRISVLFEICLVFGGPQSILDRVSLPSHEFSVFFTVHQIQFKVP